MSKAKTKTEADGQTHHAPKTVEQQSEDSFPTSDPPSFSGGGHIGAPVDRMGTVPVPAKAPKAELAKRKPSKATEAAKR